jgi:DNA-binding PadR family transcriptional regulator
MPEPKRSPFAVPVVLGLLDGAPQHGYALYGHVRDELRDVWQVGMNRLYALLIVIERQGLIKGHTERAGLRPSRRVFRITPKGKRIFEQWLHAPSQSMRDMRVDFPPKLYFAIRRGPQDVAELIQSQRGACQNELNRMTHRQRDAAHDVALASAYRKLIYDFRVGQIQSILKWLDACESELVARRAHPAKHHSQNKKVA